MLIDNLPPYSLSYVHQCMWQFLLKGEALEESLNSLMLSEY